jgi:HNH endonuclease
MREFKRTGEGKFGPPIPDDLVGQIFRFFEWVEFSETGCWLWKGRTATQGYAQVQGYRRKAVVAHRWLYEIIIGPIGDELKLDHLCRVKRCVNPDHLEAVTQSVNVKRDWEARRKEGRAKWQKIKTICKRGHPLVPGGRWVHEQCKECIKIHNRARYQK